MLKAIISAIDLLQEVVESDAAINTDESSLF